MAKYRALYEEITKFPSPVGGHFFRGADGHLLIHSDWSKGDVQRKEQLKFSCKHISLNGHWLSIFDDADSKCIHRRRSRNGKYLAAIKGIKIDGKDMECLEVWTENGLRIVNENLTELNKHAKVRPSDSQFGSLHWSPGKTLIAYVAERAETKAASFFEKDTKDKRVGEEFLYADNWGEQLTDARRPVVCVFDVASGDLTVCDWLPREYSYGQLAWLTDECILACGWLNEPYRLGLIYCSQRPAHLFLINVANSTYKILIGAEDLVPIVRLAPTPTSNGRSVAYLQSVAHGPHRTCLSLELFDVVQQSSKTVLDAVRWSKCYDDFPGIHLTNVPRLHWLSDNRHLVINSIWYSEWLLLLVDTVLGKVVRLRNSDSPCTYQLLDAIDDYILFTQESPNCPKSLKVGRVPLEALQTDKIDVNLEDTATLLSSPEPKPSWLDTIQATIIDHTVPTERINAVYPWVDRYQSILVWRNDLPASEQILCARPHGGPHSAYSPSFALDVIGMVMSGFAVLLINYRGSQGFGLDSIKSLLGHIGQQDVLDCHAAMLEVLEKFKFKGDGGQLRVFGGSHGGFLAAHLVSQFPDAYAAAVLLNPVTNLPAMLAVTDIPDWVIYEVGLIEYNEDPANKSTAFSFAFDEAEKHYEIMRLKSPIINSSKISAKCLFLVGRDDLRVPRSQALSMYKRLLVYGKRTKLLEYPDNCHPIMKIDAEADWFINLLKWLLDDD